jgi:hypothetical protein
MSIMEQLQQRAKATQTKLQKQNLNLKRKLNQLQALQWDTDKKMKKAKSLNIKMRQEVNRLSDLVESLGGSGVSDYVEDEDDSAALINLLP